CLPEREKAYSPQLLAEAVAKGCARKSVNGIRGVPRLENEDMREHALDCARVDIGLIGQGASAAASAPVTDQEMAVAVFHRAVLRPDVPLCTRGGFGMEAQQEKGWQAGGVRRPRGRG